MVISNILTREFKIAQSHFGTDILLFHGFHFRRQRNVSCIGTCLNAWHAFSLGEDGQILYHSPIIPSLEYRFLKT